MNEAFYIKRKRLPQNRIYAAPGSLELWQPCPAPPGPAGSWLLVDGRHMNVSARRCSDGPIMKLGLRSQHSLLIKYLKLSYLNFT